MLISSRTNPLIKEIASLAQGKGRREVGRTFVEGFKITEEALRWSRPQMLIITTSSRSRAEGLIKSATQHGILIQEMTDDCFAKFSQLKSPEGIAAVLPLDSICCATRASSAISSTDALFTAQAKLAVAAGIQDPSNAGAIARVAEAAGASGMVVVDGADCTNPKFLRAAMGSAFRLPCMNLNEEEFLQKAAAANLRLLASDAGARAIDYKSADYSPPVAICVGAEGQGLSDLFLQKAAHVVQIPMQGHPESLNVAVAAGILLYTANAAWV